MLTDTVIASVPEKLPPAQDPGAHWQARYWSIFVGQALSLIGSALTQFVLLWWITDTTGSVSALATAGVVALLPQALLGPVGGVFADRYSRRFLMIASDAVSAACMIVLMVLFVTETVELWHVYVMVFVRSTMQAFQSPAATASTAMLVPDSFLPRAAGLNQTMTGVMTVAAAPLGAFAISIMPLGWALGIDVVTAILGIVPLLLFSIPQHKLPDSGRSGFWRELKEGLDLVRNSPALSRIYLLLAAVVLIIMPSFALVPLLVKAHFSGGATEVALIEGIGGAGMIAGGLVVAALAPARRVLWFLTGFAVSCFALGLTAAAPGNMLWLGIVFWVISNVTFIMGNSPMITILQTSVPNQLQGRVLSLLTTVMGLAGPIGLAVATPLGELIGVRWLFVTMGIAGGVVCLLGFLSPVLRRIDQ